MVLHSYNTNTGLNYHHTSGQHMTEIDTYADQISKGVRLLLNSIASENEIGYAIVVLLMDEGKLSEDEITETLLGDTSELTAEEEQELRENISDKLDELQTGGFVSKRVGERIGDPDTGDYEVTTAGENILWALYEETTNDERPEAAQ